MNGEIIYYNGTKWGVKGFKGTGQVSCDGGVVGLINQLQQVYGLVVDKDHPLIFDPDQSEKWVGFWIPNNGR